MKSLLVLITLLFSTLISTFCWAGGPDIPWPKAIDGHHNGETETDPNRTGDEPKGAEESSPLRRSYSIYLEKNDTASSKECPFFIIIEEIDLETGEVIGERQVLPCPGGILNLKNN